MQKQLAKKKYIPLIVQKFTPIKEIEANVIPTGFTIDECTSFSIYLKDINNIIENTTKQQDEKIVLRDESVQKVYEIHRQILQYVNDFLQIFIEQFNQKFSMFFVNFNSDIPLHLLDFNGSDTFTLVMKTQNKPLMQNGIIFWKSMITNLQQVLQKYKIATLSSIYFGNICVSFYENEENQFDYYFFGSAINGSIRGCKLSKALDLQLNLLLHQDFAINFEHKTNLMKYMLKKKDSSNVKITDATILSSFYIVPYSSIKDNKSTQFSCDQQYIQSIQSADINDGDQEKIMKKVKILTENQEGFEAVSFIKLVFSIQPEHLHSNSFDNNISQSKLSSTKKEPIQNTEKHYRKSCLEGINWDIERRNVAVNLNQIMNKIQELVETLSLQYDSVFYCAFQNLLTIRLIVRNKIDYYSRAALFVSVLQQLQIQNIKKLRASSQLAFFYTIFFHQFPSQEQQSNSKDLLFTSFSNHSLRDKKVQYISKQEGVVQYNLDIVNQYFRENPNNQLSFKTHWNPILNHTQCYQNASIFLEKRSTIIIKLKEYLNQPINTSNGYQNQMILIEGDFGSGKSSFMQLLSNDIANSFKIGQCVVFTKSLRGSLMNEIKQRNAPPSQVVIRQPQRRILLNTFNDILIMQCQKYIQKLEESYLQLQNQDYKQQIAQQINQTLILQTFLTRDTSKMQLKSLVLQNASLNLGDLQQEQKLLYQENMQNEIIQIIFAMLQEYLLSLNTKLIIFMIDDLQYQDKWSWSILQKIQSSIQNSYKIIIIGTFRFHLPTEINEDIATYTQLEPQIIPMIRTSQQLYKNNEFLNQQINKLTTQNNSIRLNINQIGFQEQKKLVISAIENFYTVKIDENESKKALDFILIYLFRRYQCNTPQKILLLLHTMCKCALIIVFQTNQNQDQSYEKKRISQMSESLKSNKQQDNNLDQILQNQPSSNNIKEANDPKIQVAAFEINENFQNLEDNIFESPFDCPLYFMNLNNSIFFNLLFERQSQMILLPKQKYFSNQVNQSQISLNEDFSVSSSQNYLKDSKEVSLKNRSNLIWLVLSLQGQKLNYEKLRFFLQNYFYLPEEQITETITEMYLFRLICLQSNENEGQNQNQTNQQRKKKSLNSSFISQQNSQNFVNIEENKLNLSHLEKQKQNKTLQFYWNDNLFFLLKQSLKYKLSLRLKLLLHKSYFDCMSELLQKLYQNGATNTLDFAELYMELIHHNSQYQPEKNDTLLKKISPQITYLFRKRIYYQGQVQKFSSTIQGMAKCQIKMNSQMLYIYKEDQRDQFDQFENYSPEKKDLDTSSVNKDKTQTKFQDTINQIKADLMLSTARFQNIRSIWSISKYDYTYELIPEKLMIKIYVYHMTKHQSIGDKKTQNKALALTFPSQQAYNTFYTALIYLQAEPYNPNFSFEKRDNYQNYVYSIRYPLLKSLSVIYDPLQKTDLINQIPYSQLSDSAQSLYYIFRKQDYIKKHQSINKIKNLIYSLIPKGLLALQIQSIQSPRKSVNHIAISPQKSPNVSQNKINVDEFQQKIFEEQVKNQLINSNIKQKNISKDNSLIIEKLNQSHSIDQNLEPLDADRDRGVVTHQKSPQTKQFMKQPTLSYEDQFVGQSQQEKLFELKVLNENQPETGKFNTLEGINHVQDDFNSQAKQILIINNFDQTGTFRKQSQDNNQVDQKSSSQQTKNMNISQSNMKQLHIIQEEDLKQGVRSSTKLSHKNNSININHDQSSIYQQQLDNEIFEQIESERTQYQQLLYQEQVEQFNRNHQNIENQYNQFAQQNNHYNSNSYNGNIQNNQIPFNNNLITHQKAMNQLNVTNQGIITPMNYSDIKTNQKSSGLYHPQAITQNQQIDLRQIPLQMSVTANNESAYNIIQDIEDEENPFQTGNGIKTLQLQLSTIQSATKSRSPSPFQRNSQLKVNQPLSYYSSQKSNTATPNKASNFKCKTTDFQNIQQGFNNPQEVQHSNGIQYQQGQKNESTKQKSLNNINLSYSDLGSKQQYQNNQTYVQSANNLQNQFSRDSHKNNSFKQKTQYQRSNEQTLIDLKFQQDLQKRLEQVRLNQDEFQKACELIGNQQQDDVNQNNFLNYDSNQLGELPLPVYKERYQEGSKNIEIFPSERSDQYQIEDEIPVAQEQMGIQGQLPSQGSKLNIAIVEDQIKSASNNQLSHSQNNSRILNSQVMQDINQQPILYENKINKQNASLLKQKIFDTPQQNISQGNLNLNNSQLSSNQLQIQQNKNSSKQTENQKNHQNLHQNQSSSKIQPNDNLDQKITVKQVDQKFQFEEKKQFLEQQQNTQSNQINLSQQNDKKQQQKPQQDINNIVTVQSQQKQNIQQSKEYQNTNHEISQTREISQSSNRIQNVYVDDYTSNRNFQTPSNLNAQFIKQPQNSVQPQMTSSAQLRAQKQNEMIQKKKENLKKYQSQQSQHSNSSKIMKDSRVDSQCYVENEFTDADSRNISQFLYESNYISPINVTQSMEIYDQDSYIGIIIQPCQTLQGEKFNLKQDDCVIFKFLNEKICEVHFEGRIGCISRNNIKVVQRAQQFLKNLSSYNSQKKKQLNDSALNNVHKILTDIDKK
ncbi:hypothetical protein TTHERM_00353340 (macronuclear) [Tetrahymena thermophila SB210]|uniref:Uncharacterized protein n=1 Tax=Tetrahymena thermophila (strain SB210) TaxID=312017 RepID=I7LWU0_TETTS|nr:hypothetical protein TTHERM_00353340 [Tetrahymena thermophila SB210]EAS02848.1 hypothetical protein TTHERM_00353340 [Tetrahymena thermophila SB210]|eukprot:XP_001023093.1 hypothetical protein TTHERM_00353340 [Tetrahymena thermophila SB210]